MVTAVINNTVTTPQAQAPPVLVDGQSLKCRSAVPGKPANAVFRYNNNQLRYYPTAAIANSWNPTPTTAPITVNCSGIPIGPDMPMKPAPIPPAPQVQAPLVEGQSISCNPAISGKPANSVFRYTNNQLRYYPTSEIANSWNPDQSVAPRIVNCGGLQVGPDMAMKPTPTERQSISCNPAIAGRPADAVFRYTDGELRYYSNAAIGNSWNPNWKTSAETIDCTGIPIGQGMAMKPAPPAPVPVPPAPVPPAPIMVPVPVPVSTPTSSGSSFDIMGLVSQLCSCSSYCLCCIALIYIIYLIATRGSKNGSKKGSAAATPES